MRYLLFVLCLLLSSQVYGQRKSKKKRKEKTTSYLQIQGGFLMDRTFDLPYNGFNLINLGFSKIKNNTLRSLQLELIGFNVREQQFRIGINSPIGGFISQVRGIEKQRRSVELIYNHSFGLSPEITNGFFMGPSTSLIFNANNSVPLTTVQFPTQIICVCLGAGINTGYN